MDETHYRDGNVVLFRRSDSKKYQARIKLDNGKWKRFGTGSEVIKEASSIACERFDEIKVLSKRNLAIDTRRFKDVAELAISEMQKELDSGYGKKSYLDYIQSLNFSWEEGEQKGNDKVGEYRDWSVAYDSLEDNPENDPKISTRNDKRRETKSYIDMPNIKAFTFLNPIQITFGLNIIF